jgi:hypothetical protein
MATTTNYGWTTPDDTALVKDGAAAIRTLGSSVDTTTKALNPSTTLGDIEYRSATANTNTRLGIGSAGQVLTVAAGVPSWSTPGAAGATSVIQTITTSGGATNVSFTSIPSTYKNLRIVYSAAITAGAWEFFLMRFNNDTGSNYDRQTLQGRAGSATAAETYGSTSMHIAQINQVNATVGEIVIPAYKDTVLDKLAVSTFFGKHGTSSTNQFTGVFGGAFRSTAAITQIDLFPDTAKVYVNGSTFTLYGEA